MSDLAILGDAPVSRYGPDDQLQEEYAKGKSYLPRIEFKSGSTNVCKAKKFPIDHYALVMDKQLYDLGENFPALVLSYRYKALDFSELKTAKKVRVAYDPKSPEFQAIEAIAKAPRPKGQMSGAVFGPEFLLAVKREDGNAQLATLLCGNTSLKIVAKKLFGMTRRYVSFGSKLITGEYTYMAPEVSTYSGSFSIDSIKNLTKEIDDFVMATGTQSQDADLEDENTDVTDRVR